jgi:hypothetical protein
MPTNYICKLNVTGVGRGGRLTGPGFGGPTPTLSAQDTLQVQLTWLVPSIEPPEPLNGHFIFSAAQDAPSNQGSGSPFLQSNGYCLCYDVQTAQKTISNNQTVYSFTPYTYGGGIQGHYELTFVAEAVPSGGSDSVQWSDDPEFETGN